MFGKDFFINAFKEENNGSEEVEQVTDTPQEDTISEQPTNEEKPTDANTESEVIEEDNKEVPSDMPASINIDGTNYTIEQIKEWKQGNMRQSDYTKKTQEIARMRKELEDKGASLDDSDKTDEMKRIEKLELDLANKELDNDISNMKNKYKDFDEIEILNECERRKIYDLEFVYNALHPQVKNEINIEDVKKQAIEEYKNSLKQEIKKDTEATSGSIIDSTPGTAPVDYSEMLDYAEKAYCNKRGIQYKDYYEMKNADYNI